mgnify:FL=1
MKEHCYLNADWRVVCTHMKSVDVVNPDGTRRYSRAWCTLHNKSCKELNYYCKQIDLQRQ